MESFKDRVESLTRVAISNSSNPSTDNLESYLHQGVQDFYTKWTGINPQDVYMFARESLLFDGTGGNGSSTYGSEANFELKGGKILSVMRENGTALSFRNCRRVSYGLQDRVNDVDSLHYASKYNPAYFVSENGEISVFPSPDATNDTWKAYYLNVVPIEESPEPGETLDANSSGVKYFPDHLEYLIPLYASIKSLEAKLGEYSVTEEDVELVQSLSPLLASYKEQYQSSFMFHAPKQERKS